MIEQYMAAVEEKKEEKEKDEEISVIIKRSTQKSVSKTKLVQVITWNILDG
jgi:hypothetical protein